MSTARATWLAVVAAVLTVGYTVAAARSSAVISNVDQMIAGLTTVGMCLWTSRQGVGVERRWRLLVTLAMVGWTAGQVIYAWHLLAGDEPPGSPSLADVGYWALSFFSLLAVAVVATDHARVDPPDPDEAWRRTRLATVVCAGVAAGAIFVVAWSAGGWIGGSAQGPADAGAVIGVVYIVIDLIAVVIAGLLAVVWGVAVAHRRPFWLIAGGIACIVGSDSLYSYLVSVGQQQVPPTDVGFVVGPFLIGLAVALGPARERVRGYPRTGQRDRPVPPASAGLPGSDEPQRGGVISRLRVWPW